MMLLVFGKEQAWVYCGTCWHQYCSVLSPKQEGHREGKKIGLYFSSSSVLTGSSKLRGNWAGPWVAGFMPEITFAWCREYFNVQWDPCNDSWRPALHVVSGRVAVWKQQTNPEDFVQSLTGRKARARQTESLALFPVFFVLRYISLYSGFPGF